VPSDRTLKIMNAVHRGMLALSGGRLGWEIAHLPVVRLTTTGRTSGRPHSVMLLSPVQIGPTFVVVASRGGDDEHPAWFLNVRAAPDVEITRQGVGAQRARARVATSEERACLWPQVTAAFTSYADYQAKTTREIPLVLLEPEGRS
jgi:deazaflavin-dependent oxidoreductase (nitroreductase family)